MPDGCQMPDAIFGCFRGLNYARSGTQVASVATLIPTTHQFDELQYNKKKERKYILKVDRSIVMLNSVDYFLKSNYVVFF